MKVSGQLHALTALPPGKEPKVAIVLEVGWAPELVWKVWRREHYCGITSTFWSVFNPKSCE
jgi:hypothetical protein